MAEPLASAKRRTQDDRLEQAARAAWLYYIAGRTQDEIALQLSISRQVAQRLISRAVAEKLIKFRFDHPIAGCMELAQALTERFSLVHCDIVPGDPADHESVKGVAVAGAQYLEHWFGQRAPLVVALSTGRTLRAVASELSPLDAPQHKVMSLCGTMSSDGRAHALEPVTRVAEQTGAQCFPMPTPVVAASAEECQLLRTQRAYHVLAALLRQARCVMAGIGDIGWRCPMHASGYIDDAELTELIEAGAVGEIAGTAFNTSGRDVSSQVTARVTGLSIELASAAVRVGIGTGVRKVPPLLAALTGGRVNALITDEATAGALLRAGPAERLTGS